nr:hypothetical protein [Spirochaetota bacterium]
FAKIDIFSGGYINLCEITGVDAVISQRLIYPPENYIIADSLVTNTRFSWRTNIPTKKIFQVSKSANFKEIVYQENVETETLLGKNWGIGKYYWRIRNFNADGSVFLDSDTRSFEVTGLLAATNLITPVSASTVIALEDTIDKIEWSSVKNADYYSIEIFVDGKLIEDIPVYTKTEYEIMFAKYENASWNIKIRALANENEKATRLLGYIGEFSFKVRTLKPIVINYPKEGEAFSGLDAIRKGVEVEWDSEEDLKSSTLLISKDKEGKKIVFKKNAPLKSDNIPKLKEGIYFCNLLGRTSSGYDITTKSPISFMVEKIPNLPKASRTDPADGGVIDFEYLKTRKSIVLEWDNIEGANCYELKLYRVSDNKLMFQDDSLKDNFYKFVNLKEFSRGEFKWTIKGKSLDSNGVLEQNGEILESVFRLDIPEISKQEEKKIEGLYGQ